VIRTRVGYAGGDKENPTYYSLGGHAETIQIDYDPARISYAALLDLFWASHSPTVRPFSTQYASIIFYRDEEQKRLAEESRDREAARRGAAIYTEIQPLTRFYLAEDYHQKYRLRQDGVLLAEFQSIYPNPADLVASTAAARVNGYLGGNGTLAQLQAEIGSLGLSPAGKERLLERVSVWP
jgi:peptide-methionine (S)-S-oxide reductase